MCFFNFINNIGKVWYIPVALILGTVGGIVFYINTISAESSKYFIACSNEFVSEPESSPTFIIFI